MANPDTSQAKRDDVIQLTVAAGPERTPGQRRVFEEAISATVRHAQRRMQNMVFTLAPERAKRLEAAVKRIKSNELRGMIEGDLECDEKDWGPNAAGTASFIERHLGIEPRIPREKLKSLNLESPTLVHDVLALSEGAFQDIGFSVIQQTPDGEKATSFAELDLRQLDAT